MPFRVVDATSEDGPDILSLLPRLGAFPRPDHRSQDQIHEGDERVIRAWIDGEGRIAGDTVDAAATAAERQARSA